MSATTSPFQAAGSWSTSARPIRSCATPVMFTPAHGVPPIRPSSNESPMPAAQVNGSARNCQINGPEPALETIVLMNGLADDLESGGCRIPALVKAGFRVRRFDGRGIGKSDAPEGVIPRGCWRMIPSSGGPSRDQPLSSVGRVDGRHHQPGICDCLPWRLEIGDAGLRLWQGRCVLPDHFGDAGRSGQTDQRALREARCGALGRHRPLLRRAPKGCRSLRLGDGCPSDVSQRLSITTGGHTGA